MNISHRHYVTRSSLAPLSTDCQIHSIVGCHPEKLLDEAMSISRLLLPRLSLLLPLLFLGGFSLSALAWEGHHRAPWVGTTLAGEKCDGGQVPFGPFDYLQRAMFPGQLEVVEENHFTPNVESLASGNTTTAMGDIHYTLQTWPNHHRALNSAFRFRLKHREQWKQKANLQSFPAECYLQRAMKFSPGDPVAYLLYGMLMHQMQQYDKALKAYQTAVKLQPDDLITQYNMGLTLFAMKKYPAARQVAKNVYAKGFPLPGLKRKLAAAGQWDGAKPAPNPAASKAKAPEVNVSDVPDTKAKDTATAMPATAGGASEQAAASSTGAVAKEQTAP
jgi:hypothetical protein